MASALFLASDKSKYMLMLNAYMDETGHSSAQDQKFNGMAGLFARADDWAVFEEKWKEVLARKEYRLPYFHMREFIAADYGSSKSLYKGWSEAKRQKLFGKLMRLIAGVHPIPVGAVIHMPDYRGLTEVQKTMLRDPYFLTYQNVIAYATSYLDFVKASPDVKVGFIFSDQVEFKYRALQLYDEIYKSGIFIKRSAYAPDFRPMQDFPALQAADIVAYEMYKEYERVMYRPNDRPRYGYNELEKMSLRHGFKPMFRFYSKAELTDYVREGERAQLRWEYWEKRKKLKGAS
jgi:hypothetical protein